MQNNSLISEPLTGHLSLVYLFYLTLFPELKIDVLKAELLTKNYVMDSISLDRQKIDPKITLDHHDRVHPKIFRPLCDGI
jgi:hypothetical protein